MVVARCACVVPALLALSALLVHAQNQCASQFKGQVNSNPHPLVPQRMEPGHCVYDVTVPDSVCHAPNGENNLGLLVTGCDQDSPPVVQVLDDLVHAVVSRTDCAHVGTIAVTVNCKDGTRVGLSGLAWGAPQGVPAGLQRVVPRVLTGVQRFVPGVPRGVQDDVPLVVPVNV